MELIPTLALGSPDMGRLELNCGFTMVALIYALYCMRGDVTGMHWHTGMHTGMQANMQANLQVGKSATPNPALVALPDITGLNFSAVITSVTQLHLADITAV